MNFEITPEEWQKIAAFRAKKIEQYGTNFGAIGGEMTYSFSPTSLGTVTKAIFCQGTEMEDSIDVTPYEEW